MREAHLQYLACPATKRPLVIAEGGDRHGDRVRNGELVEPVEGRRYPIRNFIPYFAPADNYARSFGVEWNIHDRTQFDADSGHDISERRFRTETGWQGDLTGQLLLEAGSGSGRFTHQALRTGAVVVSFDYSSAVEANYRSNGTHPNLCLVQGDIFSMPFAYDRFDKVFCLGVLQHTPDPKRAFLELVKHLKPGGRIGTDIYKKTLFYYWLSTKYWVRPFTRNMEPQKLYRRLKAYVDFMWPVARVVRRLPKGTGLNWQLLIADYSAHLPNASEAVWKEWAYLDTFDMLAPRYDKPETLENFTRWHHEAGLEQVDVCYGYNGIEGRGAKRSAAA